VFDLHSKPFKTPFLGIIEFSSEIAQALLERCISKRETTCPFTKKANTTVSEYVKKVVFFLFIFRIVIFLNKKKKKDQLQFQIFELG
jgi:hypothetical protein